MQHCGTIGIIGGMGPAATVDLFKKIVDLTPATKDQEHLRVVIDNNPRIPDRLPAIMHGKADPVPDIIAMAQNLQSIGADVLLMPCNTAHIFLERLQQAVSIPFLSIIDCSARYIQNRHPSVRKVGLLGTDVTVYLGMHRQVFAQHHLSLVIPDAEVQKNCVMRAIYGNDSIKAGKIDYPRQLLISACKNLIDRGAELIVLGCTELPLAIKPSDTTVPLIDATEVLAQAAIDFVNNADNSQPG